MRTRICFFLALSSIFPVCAQYVQDNRSFELLSTSQQLVANQESLPTNELLKILQRVTVNLEQNQVVMRIQKSWYYPSSEVINHSGYESLGFNGFSDQIIINSAFSTDGDGQVVWLTEDNIRELESDSRNVFTEGRELVVTYAGLAAGGITGIDYQITTDLDKLEANWSKTFFPQTNTDTLRYELDVNWDEVDAPAISANDIPLDCIETDISLSCSGEYIAPAEEDKVVIVKDLRGQITITNEAEWQGVVSNIDKKFQKAISHNQDVEKFTRDLVAKSNTIEEKVSVIHNFISRDIRYVSVSEAGNAFTPHAVSETLSNRFGDCKDKSALLIAMLDVLGIESYPVLVATDRTDPGQLVVPSANYFDHAVVCFDYLEQKYCLDPTDRYSDWTYISDWIQRTVSLPIKFGAVPQQLQYSMYRWKTRNNTTLKFDQSGGQIEKSEVTMESEYASYYRSKLASLNKEQQTEWLHSLYDEVVANNYEPTINAFGIESLEDNIIIKTDNRFEPYFEVEDFSITENDPWILYELGLSETQNKHLPEFFPGVLVVSHFSVTFPENWLLKSPPGDLELTSKFGSLTREVARTEPNKMQIRSELNLPARLVAVNELQDFNRLLDVFKKNSTLRFTGGEKAD